MGRAVQIAAEGLKQRLEEAAASILGTIPKELRFEACYFFSPKAPDQRISVAQAVKKLENEGRMPVGEGVFDPEIKALDPKTSQGHPMATYGFATQGALVSVDTESGEVEVLTVVASHDVGKAINPSNVIGQIEGSVSMGMGYSLMEEVVLEGGRIRNPRYSQYMLPTSLDMPEVVSYLVEEPEASGPFGAKGIGEPALVPTAPAIVNAIDVAAGVRVKSLPATAEALWRLLKARRGKEEGTGSLGQS